MRGGRLDDNSPYAVLTGPLSITGPQTGSSTTPDFKAPSLKAAAAARLKAAASQPSGTPTIRSPSYVRSRPARYAGWLQAALAR
jgi:hypothetical protein